MDTEIADMKQPSSMVDTETPTDIQIWDAGSSVRDMERDPVDVLPPDVDMLGPLQDMTALARGYGRRDARHVTFANLETPPSHHRKLFEKMIAWKTGERCTTSRGSRRWSLPMGRSSRGAAGVCRWQQAMVVEDLIGFIGSCTKAMTATWAALSMPGPCLLTTLWAKSLPT